MSTDDKTHSTPLFSNVPAVPAEVSPLTDEELLHKIRRSPAAYRFGQLWRGRQLQHRVQGRDFRLTDVHGEVVRKLLV